MPTPWRRGSAGRAMLSLADLQGQVRQAVVLGDAPALDSLLVGGGDGRARLAIHRRHYESSLVRALLDRFPATVWLVGSDFVTQTARQFVRECPPSGPCLAEYGEGFPAFLAGRRGTEGIPYLKAFAELEWHLGRLSLAVTRPALTRTHFSALDSASLADVTITVQPCVHYLRAAWAIDDLMRAYLTAGAPDRFLLDDAEVWLELRGARGELRMNRLDPAAFTFRTALAAGQPLADAALAALDIDAAFDAGQALTRLIDEGLVAAFDVPHAEGSAV